MNELITVIIPVYNTREKLIRCVNSIQRQTYKNLDILLIDDGSDNETVEIENDLMSKDERIRKIHQNRGGVSKARNTGIQNAKGSYVAFVDHDDYLSPDMYEKLYRLIKDNGVKLSMCNFEYVDEEGNRTKQNIDDVFENKIYSYTEALDNLYKPSRLYWSMTWNKLIRSEIARDIEFPEGKLCEDSFVMPKLYCEAKQIAITTDVLYHYVQYNSSQGHMIKEIVKLDRLNDIYNRINFYKENGLNTYMIQEYEELLSFVINAKYRIKVDKPDVKEKRDLLYDAVEYFFSYKPNRTLKNYSKCFFAWPYYIFKVYRSKLRYYLKKVDGKKL